jgi:2-dehydropantoate 2-reductase
MKAIENVVLVGLGAVGAIYATQLHDYDPSCLRVLLSADRLDRYRRQGIILNGKRYDFKYALPHESDVKADLIVIATKSTGLAEAITAIEGFVGEGTIILSLLNGITSEELLAEKYGWEKLLYSFFIGHVSTRVGMEIDHDGEATIMFGAGDNTTLTDNVQRVAAFCDRVGIKYQIPPDMIYAMWRKFAINVGFNQASAILRSSYGVFQQHDQVMAVARDLMAEVVALARKMNVSGADEMIETGLQIMYAMPPEGRSSMLQDVEAGRVTEVDLFAGTVTRLGRKHGIPTPLNDLFLRLISALDEVNSSPHPRPLNRKRLEGATVS